MRDFRDAKAMAQSLRHALNAKSVSLTHGECLELVAKTLGFPDWNVLAARIQSSQPTVTESGTSAPATVPPSIPTGTGVPVIAMRDLVVFPQMVAPIFIGREKTKRAIKRAMASDGRVLMVAQRRAADDDPTLDSLYAMGVTASVINWQTLVDGTLKIFVSGLERTAVVRLIEDECLAAEVAPVEQRRGQTAEAFTLSRVVLDAYLASTDGSSIQASDHIDPGMLADSIAPFLVTEVATKQEILEVTDVVTRLEMILELINAGRPAA